MIQTKTVLVLGAGASKPYGFPTGVELKKQVEEACLRPAAFNLGRFLINTCRFDEPELVEFGRRLSMCGVSSVDAFLERQPDKQIELIGKSAIILGLIPHETLTQTFNRQNDDWYQYLFQSAMTGCSFEEFSTNQLSLVTFNYDRSVESYLLTALQNLHGKSEVECLGVLAGIPIVHLHGQLGTIDPKHLDYRPYNQEVSRETIVRCRIKIVHQAVDGDPEFERARELLRAAERVCFLGFGYDERNVKRLLGDPTILIGKEVLGTSFGLTDAEKKHYCSTRFGAPCVTARTSIKERCVNMGLSTWGVLEFLRQTGVLL